MNTPSSTLQLKENELDKLERSLHNVAKYYEVEPHQITKPEDLGEGKANFYKSLAFWVSYYNEKVCISSIASFFKVKPNEVRVSIRNVRDWKRISSKIEGDLRGMLFT
jgi:hypothetical protein